MGKGLKKYHILVEILESAGLKFQKPDVGSYWLGADGITAVMDDDVPAILFDVPSKPPFDSKRILNNYMISISNQMELIISKRDVDFAGMTDLRLPVFCEDLHEPDSIDKAIELIGRIKNGEKVEYLRQKREDDRLT